MKIHFALAVVMIWQATKALHRPLTYNDFMREDSIAHINERFAHDAGKPHAVRTVRTYSTCMTASNIIGLAERDTMNQDNWAFVGPYNKPKTINLQVSVAKSFNLNELVNI